MAARALRIFDDNEETCAGDEVESNVVRYLVARAWRID